MISDREVSRAAARLGVPEGQVRRDHLLSHLIRGLKDVPGIVFVGGTALNRTYLSDARLSEDIDLHLLNGGSGIVDELLDAVRLEFPDLSIQTQSRYGDVTTAILASEDLRVQVQLVSFRHDWARLPTRSALVRLRYGDLDGAVELRIPTTSAFVAMKIAAFVDRRAARDLFDLAQLARLDLVDTTSLDLTKQLLGRRPVPAEFALPPSNEEWRIELSHQVKELGTPEDALTTVRSALAELLDW